MELRDKLLIGGAISSLAFLPVFKCGRTRGISMAQALYNHTIFADEPSEEMVEGYEGELKRLGVEPERCKY